MRLSVGCEHIMAMARFEVFVKHEIAHSKCAEWNVQLRLWTAKPCLRPRRWSIFQFDPDLFSRLEKCEWISSNVWRRSVTRSQRAHLITEERPHTVTDLKIIEADRAESVLDVGTRTREDRHLGTSNTPGFFAADIVCS